MEKYISEVMKLVKIDIYATIGNTGISDSVLGIM